MEAATQSAEALRKQIDDTEAQLSLLKEQLAKVEAETVEKSLKELSVENV
jgi:phage-related minor tail protein